MGSISNQLEEFNFSALEDVIISRNFNVETLWLIREDSFTSNVLYFRQRYVMVQELSPIHGQVGQPWRIRVLAVCIAAMDETTHVPRVR